MHEVDHLERVSLAIEGMTCSACSSRLERAFRDKEGVVQANVNLPLEVATLEVDPDRIDLDGIVDVVQNTGFDVGTETKSFGLEGMTCSACVSRAEKALLETPGVLNADVNLALESTNVTYLNHVVDYEQLSISTQNAGFTLTNRSLESVSQGPVHESGFDRYRLIIACVISVLFMIQMVAQWFGWEDIHLMPAMEVSLASIVIILVGPRFFRSALLALRNRSANMDVLVSLGTLSAYFFSWFLMVKLGEAAEGELYFEAVVLILTLVLLGKHLEAGAKRATTTAVRDLLNMRPSTVTVVLDNEESVERPIAQLKVGDLFLCQAGQLIAADGLIRKGEAHVDESLVTGESRPNVRQIGDSVIEGSVNLDGHLVVQTSAVGADSTLQKIVKMIENAQVGKTGIQRLVDRVSAFFVPVVISIAVLVFLGWLAITGDFETALISSVSVLVIACPCALGLATPTAVMTGVGAAAKSGILFKDLNVLETVQRIDTVVLDKTGTITETDPELGEIDSLQQLATERCLQLAGSLQAKSAHPIASAFNVAMREAKLKTLDVSNFLTVVGQGVQGEIESRVYYLGSIEYLKSEGLVLRDFAEFEDTVFLASDEGVLASFRIHEHMRDHANTAIQGLQRTGIQPILLSGDSEDRVAAIASELGITTSHGKMLPEDKVDYIKRAESGGSTVAMVGDGINDAPALAAATVGIAMRSATNVAMEVAPVTLMHSDVRLLPAVVDVSRATFRKIKQNLFWAFIYNIVMLPLAAMGILSPTIAGAAMAMSSLSVVLNSLWLRKWRPEHLTTES